MSSFTEQWKPNENGGWAPQLSKEQILGKAAQPDTIISNADDTPPPNWKPMALNAKKEQKFQTEFRASPFFKEFVARHGEEPQIDGGSYDYRRFWKDGMQVTRDEQDGTLHAPSKDAAGEWIKSPDHPTAWKEIYMRKYGVDPDQDPQFRWRGR